MKKARSSLVLLLLAALTVKVLWDVVEPMIPYLIAALAVVLIIGFIYHRITRW